MMHFAIVLGFPNCTECPIGGHRWRPGTSTLKAAEFNTRARSEARPQKRVQFENLAKAHLRLAEQADLNDRVECDASPWPPLKILLIEARGLKRLPQTLTLISGKRRPQSWASFAARMFARLCLQ